MIIAMRNGNAEQKRFIKDAIMAGGVENLDAMVDIVQETGGLRYTSDMAHREKCLAAECLKSIDGSIYKSSMDSLLNFVVDRSH